MVRTMDPGGGAGTTTPSGSTWGLVDQWASKYGVPTWIAEDIVKVESNGRANAVGDNGSSFGLLQLHRGGQAGNYATSQLMDPNTNLMIGMPYIAAGYQAASKAGYSGFQLLEETAGMSGHPGGSPGNYIMTSSYAGQLRAVYNGGGSTADASGSGAGASSGTNAKNPMTFQDGMQGFLSGIDNAMQIDFQWTSPVQSLLNDSGAIAFRAFLFLLGLIVIIFGLAIIARKVVLS